MFLATLVYVNKEFKSILVFKIENSNIQDIMQFRSGYGLTQEDYILSKNNISIITSLDDNIEVTNLTNNLFQTMINIIHNTIEALNLMKIIIKVQYL